MFIPMMSGNVLLMILSLGVMLWLSPPLALVSLIIAPALMIVSYRMRTKIFPATWDAQQKEGEVIQIVDEAVNGVRVVKAFGQEHRELERVADSSEELYGSQMRAVRLTSRYQPLMQAIPGFGQVAILAFGGWLALHGDISLGTFLAFTTYVGQLVSPTRQLAGLLAIGQQARAGVERIFQLLDHEPEIQDAPDAVDLPPVAGDIDLVDVHFGYDERRDVLEDFNLSIKAGERVAIVGPSGSGKSTATLLVSRFYEPDRGAVLVDGHDVRGLTLHSLRSQIGVVFEESFLFSDTVKANIAYGRPGASDAEIEAAARVAQADGFIAALPRGYDSVVGERGLTLSGGQRQRIALARALVRRPRLLVLDEVTSALDPETEREICANIRAFAGETTVLAITHRPAFLEWADIVYRVGEAGVAREDVPPPLRPAEAALVG
jgi:ATP-binding cassette subfamily B protein